MIREIVDNFSVQVGSSRPPARPQEDVKSWHRYRSSFVAAHLIILLALCQPGGLALLLQAAIQEQEREESALAGLDAFERFDNVTSCA